MSPPLATVHPRVKRPFLALCTLVVCSSAFAIEVDPKLDRAVRDALPVCSESKISYDELGVKLPARFSGAVVKVESERPVCQGMYAAILSIMLFSVLFIEVLERIEVTMFRPEKRARS